MMACGFLVDVELDSTQRLQSIVFTERREGMTVLCQMLDKTMVRNAQLIHLRTGQIIAHGPGRGTQ